jgi:hypothetical protein
VPVPVNRKRRAESAWRGEGAREEAKAYAKSMSRAAAEVSAKAGELKDVRKGASPGPVSSSRSAGDGGGAAAGGGSELEMTLSMDYRGTLRRACARTHTCTHALSLTHMHTCTHTHTHTHTL